MPRVKPKQITSWSFSRYSTYKQCPFKAKLAYLDKIQEPPNKYMERGAQIHKKAERYIKGEISRVPTELQDFKDLFKELRKKYRMRNKSNLYQMVVEDNWAFTKTWTETVWNDWIHCWVRIKLDLAQFLDETTLQITDWKTGKFNPMLHEDYMEQLELYALAALLLYEHVETVQPRLVYLDQNKIYPDEDDKDFSKLIFTRKDIPRLKKLWEKRVRAMMLDNVFAPRPNDKCCWCHYRASNKANGGGQCKY